MQPDTQSCPFCLGNNLLDGQIVQETANAFLIDAKGAAGNYLIIPKQHCTAPVDLPESWWREMQDLLPAVPGLGTDYNISLNVGKAAGQTVSHLHFWIVPRQSGLPASGKGLARLIDEANQE